MNLAYQQTRTQTRFITFADALAYVEAPIEWHVAPEMPQVQLFLPLQKPQLFLPLPKVETNPLIGKVIGKGSYLNGYQIIRIFKRWDIEWVTLARGIGTGDILHRKTADILIKDLI